jgi:spermidine/putrescine transport system substrate-binding protein
MPDRHDPIDRAVDALRRASLTRRQLLRRAGAGVGFLSLSAILAACGIKPAASGAPTAGASATPGATGTATAAATAAATATAGASASATAGASASATASESPTASPTEAPTEAPSPTAVASPAGQLIWANWPLYIDTDDNDKSKHQTLIDFTAETGIKVKYSENIQGNEGFFGTIQPDLAAGNATPYDLIVMSDWMIAKLISFGYLEPLDVANDVPNFGPNAAQFARDPWYDPGNKYSVLYQSGITGIGYNIKQTGREITSFDDLLDPKFKGRVGMFSEMRDTMGLSLLSLGIKPVDATLDQVKQAQEKLLAAAKTGQFRNFYGNEYTDELANGNLALSIAWSGDVFQLAIYDNPDLRFVVPKDGGMFWTDNMCIPNKAAHPVDARRMMDYLYRPEVAAQLSEYVGYFTPVAPASAIVRQHASEAEAAGDKETAATLTRIAKTIDPTPDQLANAFPYKNLDATEERAWNELFNAVIQG